MTALLPVIQIILFRVVGPVYTWVFLPPVLVLSATVGDLVLDYIRAHTSLRVGLAFVCTPARVAVAIGAVRGGSRGGVGVGADVAVAGCVVRSFAGVDNSSLADSTCIDVVAVHVMTLDDQVALAFSFWSVPSLCRIVLMPSVASARRTVAFRGVRGGFLIGILC